MKTRISLPAAAPHEHAGPRVRPKLGFLGVGWIGRHRLQAVAECGTAECAALADASPDALQSALELVPAAEPLETLEGLFDQDLDGVVIATPSALHARQATAALERGLAVFCQKPLARTAAETEAILDAARRNGRLLAVDLCYRHVRGVDAMRERIQAGELGRVYAVDLTFHNAYGPDKPWFYDPALSGGGCVIDLGTHLVDLALWMLDFPQVAEVHSQLYRQGQRLDALEGVVEDYALADWTFHNGTTARLACSWNLPAGQDAVIEAVFYGTQGAVALRNVNGSFWDFTVEHMVGTSRQRLAGPPDAWGGRAILDWVSRLEQSPAFDTEAERLLDVATLLDAIYRR